MNESDRPLATNPGKRGATLSFILDNNERPVILSLLKDIPNIVTLLGLSSGVLGIYFALVQNFPAAIVAMLWAVLFDWYDGLIARRMPGRSDVSRSIGIQLDSLADIISAAVCPAIILLSYGDFGPWFFPGALVLVMAGAVRLAYFNTFGTHEDGTIAGLSMDIAPLVVALVFLLEGILDHSTFAVLLYVTIVVLSFLHVAPFRMQKMVGRWHYVISAYVLIMTIVYVLIP